MDNSQITNNYKPLAIVDDLRAFCGSEAVDDEARASSLLEYASNYLRQVANNNQVNLDDVMQSDALLASNAKNIVLSAVSRAIALPANLSIGTGYSMSATPYSQSVTGVPNSDDSVYFKNSELKLLGFNSVGRNSQFGILRGVL